VILLLRLQDPAIGPVETAVMALAISESPFGSSFLLLEE